MKGKIAIVLSILIFAVSALFAQTNSPEANDAGKVTRKIVSFYSYSFWDNQSEDMAELFDHVEFEWFKETEKWLSLEWMEKYNEISWNWISNINWNETERRWVFRENKWDRSFIPEIYYELYNDSYNEIEQNKDKYQTFKITFFQKNGDTGTLTLIRGRSEGDGSINWYSNISAWYWKGNMVLPSFGIGGSLLVDELKDNNWVSSFFGPLYTNISVKDDTLYLSNPPIEPKGTVIKIDGSFFAD